MATIKMNQVVTFRHDGRTLVFGAIGALGEALLDLDRLHPSVVKRALIYGMKQRISNAAAQSRDPKTGASASPAAKLAAMTRLVDHYNSGAEEWSPRQSDEDKMTLLGEALAELRPDRTREQVQAYVTGLSKADRVALEARADVQKIIARLTGADQVDTDRLLSEF
jgi:hypothetical protein